MPRLIGYARVSTADQNPQLQQDALDAAGCSWIIHERASGASRSRPQLIKLLHDLRAGDTVVVWKLDRAARSLPHLLDVIERIREAGAHFRCLTSPIDTASPTGTFTLQILGAVAEFERAQIVERTRAGLDAAKLRGRVGGNPKLRARDPGAIELAARRRRAYFIDQVRGRIEDWRSIVTRHRPAADWTTIVRMVNAPLPAGRRFTRRSLLRHVHTAVHEGLIDQNVLQRSRPDSVATIRRHPAYAPVVLALRQAKPPTLKEIGKSLEEAGIRTPRGAKSWPISSVGDLVAKVRATMIISQQTD